MNATSENLHSYYLGVTHWAYHSTKQNSGGKLE